jgi:hypothetical protein
LKTPTSGAYFRFRFYDVMRRRWYTARYRATIDDMTLSHAAVQPLGEPERRVVNQGGLTAGHLAVGPATSS